MQTALLLLPDFMLIALGFAVCRWTPLDRGVWEGAERHVYYLLFPVLLFNSVLKSPLSLGGLATLGACGLAILASGIALAYALGLLPGIDKRLLASGAQVAFRFNSYVGLALAERLGGAEGVAAIALLLAIAVPVVNIAAVWPLARHGGHGVLRELARNPLIIGTLAGITANLAGLQFPAALSTTLQRIGVAALPIGLMAVGAGLRFGALRAAPRLAAALLTIRHLVVPLVAIALLRFTSLTPLEQLVLVAFAALPTASSCFVLAARLGGDGSYTAGLVTLSTLLGMLSVPLALGLYGALSGHIAALP